MGLTICSRAYVAHYTIRTVIDKILGYMTTPRHFHTQTFKFLVLALATVGIEADGIKLSSIGSG